MMPGMFQLLEGESCVLRAKGVYKEAKLATRNGGELYASYGGGFVRLNADGSTSVGSSATLDTLSLVSDLHRDRFGRLALGTAADRKPLDVPPAYLALTKDD